MASGPGGFLARWLEYFATRRGGNIGLKAAGPSDDRVSVIKTIGSTTPDADLLAWESRWKHELQRREMGLNRN